MLTLEQYDAARAEIDRLWGDEKLSADDQVRFQQLVMDCEEFENVHWPMYVDPPLSEEDWAAYHRENGRLPCGHMNRDICSATSCDGVPKQRDPMGVDA